MKRIIYLIFGNKWKYSFTGSMNGQGRVDFRVCKRTHQTQYLYTDVMKTLNNGKPFWINCVSYTSRGAKNHFSKNLLS